MDLFDKCKVFQQKVEYVKGKNSVLVVDAIIHNENAATDDNNRLKQPGNVRELKNAIERAVVLAPEDQISPDLLLPQLTQEPEEEIAVGRHLDEALLKFKRQFIAKTLAPGRAGRTNSRAVRRTACWCLVTSWNLAS